MSGRIATVGLLRDALAAYPPDARVLIAVQPGYPQAVTIGTLTHTPDPADQDPDAVEPDAAAQHGWQGVVWIAEGEPVGYLPAVARDGLGGRWTR